MEFLPEVEEKIIAKYGEPVWDTVTGYTLNYPLCLQRKLDFREWFPDAYAEYVKRREAAGFYVDDDDASL